MRWALFLCLLFACGEPVMPKGPPPEYEDEPGASSAPSASAAPSAAPAPAPAPEHS